MFRKLAIALVAVAALSSPSFAFGGGHLGGGIGPHFGSGHFAGGAGRLFGHFHGRGFFRDDFDDVSDLAIARSLRTLGRVAYTSATDDDWRGLGLALRPRFLNDFPGARRI